MYFFIALYPLRKFKLQIEGLNYENQQKAKAIFLCLIYFVGFLKYKSNT